ncbi:MAG TPA: acetyltransferase [Gemmatimonadaceae bacterium]|nr:acetyltransferase [Gemmatimonadaceae bacterium]
MDGSAILVFGAGGHGKVVADLARAAGFRVLGFVDRNPDKVGQVIVGGGGTVLYSDSTLDSAFIERGTLDGARVAVALGIGDNAARMTYADRLLRCDMPPLVHPRAAFSPESSLGAGAVVFANAVVNPGTQIGRACVINSGAIVEHDNVIGDGAHISPGAVLNGGVRVGTLTWIGAQAVVLPGVTIGERAVVGAGAVVLRDVADGVTVVGNPARPIRRRS